MNKHLTRFLIWLAIPALGFAAGNIKTQGDASNGSLNNLSSTDLLYVLQSPYGSGDDAYVTGANLSTVIGNGPVLNAVTDGGIVADYVDRLTPGTDVRQDIIDWISGTNANCGTDGAVHDGYKNFYFPPGHYLIGEGSGNSSTVLDLQGWAANPDGANNVRIFGVPGQTFFHSPQGLDLKHKNNPFIRVGWQISTYGTRIEGITFINDPYVTNSEESAIDGDIYWGWKYYEPHRESQAYTKGDIIVSTDDSWLISVTVGGISDATEPTWSGATTTDGTCTVTVVALNDWQATTGYSAGAHVKTTTAQNYHTTVGATTRSIMWAANSGTSGSAEAELSRPSADGAGGTNFWQWVAFSYYSGDNYMGRCEFSGMAGFSEAGGTALGLSESLSGIYEGGLVENCYFHDAAYGGVVTGGFNNWTFRNCSHYKLGGWGYCYGTYNAHGYYNQGRGNLWESCKFERHFYGLDIKTHGNQPNNDNWQNRIINCEFRDYGWSSVEWVGGGEIYSESLANGADFILSATSGSSESAIMEKAGSVIGCTFRIFKTAYDDYDWRRPTATPNSGSGYAILIDCVGVNVVGCSFIDSAGVKTGTSNPIVGANTPATVDGCSFITIFRKADPLAGTWAADNCVFDFRAVLDFGSGINVTTYSRLTNSTIAATTTSEADASYGLVKMVGAFAKADNNQIILDSTGFPVSFGNGSGGTAHEWMEFTNNVVIAPTGTIYAYPRSDAKYFRFENNYWDIAGWDYTRLSSTNHETWTWKNERGNLFTSFWDATKDDFNGGVVKLVPNPANTARTAGDLVDSSIDLATTSADIYGVYLKRNGFTTYLAWLETSENANHWLRSSAAVTQGDWITMSATAGQIQPNGTTGSTTRPATGIQGRVINVGDASAGAGRCQVEILEWNR